MGLKIWLALASMLMVFDIAYGAAASTITCDPAVEGGTLKCTCALGAGDARSAKATWKFDNTGTTTGLSGNDDTIFQKTGVAIGDNGKNVKCTYADSTESTPGATTEVKANAAATIACTPAPTKVGMETTCTCTKPASVTAPSTMCKLIIGTTEQTAAACDSLKYTPKAEDKDKKITCKAVYLGADSLASTTAVVTITYTKQAKPTIEGAKTDATADLTITCKAADTTETGLTYKLFDKDGKEVTLTDNKKATYVAKICDAEVNTEYKFTCSVTNAGGESDKSDAATVKFTKAGTGCPTKAPGDSAAGFRPSLMILGSILLLTTILLKQ